MCDTLLVSPFFSFFLFLSAIACDLMRCDLHFPPIYSDWSLHLFLPFLWGRNSFEDMRPSSSRSAHWLTTGTGTGALLPARIDHRAWKSGRGRLAPQWHAQDVSGGCVWCLVSGLRCLCALRCPSALCTRYPIFPEFSTPREKESERHRVHVDEPRIRGQTID